MKFLNDLLYSSVEVKKVHRVQFGIFGPEEIKRMSVVEIKNSRKFESGEPVEDGLMDPRLGAIGGSIPCRTCECDEKNCPGHFGHIELCKPVFNVCFLGTTIRVLRSTCFYCAKVLIDKTARRRILAVKNKANRLRQVEKNKSSFCLTCGHKQPSYKRDLLHFVAEISDKEESRKQSVTAEKVYSIFKQISDDDCELLGLSARWSRPEWLVITLLPVPPPHVRPSIMLDPVNRGEDDLTFKLADIVSASTLLREHETRGSPAHLIDEKLKQLEYHVATYMNNETPNIPRSTQKSGRQIKSVIQRFKGKEGRIRGNLMGKRVNFSARTVITPDPNLELDEVGVPQSIAMNLTYPETVTPYNYDRMLELVSNGPDVYPGANYIETAEGRPFAIMYLKDKPLEEGWKVIRHISDGDVVLFNRQPSLHKMSIMGHRIRVLPHSTFRLNLSVTSPYNADFDGDEMNMHVAQSHGARAEIQELMGVNNNIVSPQANKPVMGIVQDTLLGCSLFTQRDTFLEKDLVMNLLMHIGNRFDGRIPTPCILKPKPLWSGKQLFSLILPDVNVVRYSKSHPDDESGHLSPGDSKVLIQGGNLVCGIIDKNTVGSSAGSLVHVTFKEHGAKATADLLYFIQVLVNHWLLQRGFSIGVGDTLASRPTLAIVDKIISKAKGEVETLVKKAQMKELTRSPGKNMEQSFEYQVNNFLKKANGESGLKAQRSLPDSNNFKRMSLAGSKGDIRNVASIAACVGQQNVEGGRIRYGFRNRTLPHFPINDLAAESRGFVANSYVRGLKPSEFFFHAMGGREGLIDTAIKTAETGYIQRRLMKAMEDIMVKYDSTVRNSAGQVIQFLYGEDGMDGGIFERQKLAHLKMSNRALESRYKLNPYDPNFGCGADGKPYLEQSIIEACQDDPDVGYELTKEYEQIVQDRHTLRNEIVQTGEDALPLCLNVDRIIWDTKSMYSISSETVSNLNPKDIVIGVKNMLKNETIVIHSKPGSAQVSNPLEIEDPQVRLAQDAQQNATLLFQIHIRSMLSSKEVLMRHRLTKTAWEHLLGEIRNRFLAAICPPGEMIGALAAQSVSEPATQMTLNTFHHAGDNSGHNLTAGVPRLKELINVTKSPKTPSLTVYLSDEATKDEQEAKSVQAELQYTTLRTVTNCTEIFYDPDPEHTIIEADDHFVSGYFALPEKRPVVSPWVLRLQLSKEKLIDRKIGKAQVVSVITSHFGTEDLDLMMSDDNDDEIVLRIRIINRNATDGQGEEYGDQMDDDDDDEEPHDLTLRRIEQELFSLVRFSGVMNIEKVFMRQPDKVLFDPETGAFVTDDARVKEWVLDTEGVNLLAVMAHKNVDHTRTISNHVTDMFEVLGIEGARASLLNEVRSVLTGTSYINYRHLALLADVMTFMGRLLPITRHGVKSIESGPLMRCTFESMAEILQDAAIFAELDDLKGVSQNIMLGQLMPGGTGEFGLYLDETGLEGTEEYERGRTPGSEYVDVISNTPRHIGTPGHFTPRHPGMGVGSRTPGFDASMTPSYAYTPRQDSQDGAASPILDDAVFSPTARSPAVFAPMSPADGLGMSPYTPRVAGMSPAYHGASPGHGMGDSDEPTAPMYSPSSPAYSPSSPAYSPTSPKAQNAGAYSPSSPQYSPSSPAYSPSSPNYSPSSPQFSPSSPAYGAGGAGGASYSPSSPQYSPASPAYSPASPAYSPSSPAAGYSPSSPQLSPSSPQYSPSSPQYSPSSPKFSPSSPKFSPSSPKQD